MIGALFPRGVPSAGLFLGPAAFLVDTQANYAAVPLVCATHWPLVPLIALTTACVATLGGLLSWRALAFLGMPREEHSGGLPQRFIAGVAVAVAAIAVLVIVLHGTAFFFFHGCER
jgi:hypothetical protein